MDPIHLQGSHIGESGLNTTNGENRSGPSFSKHILHTGSLDRLAIDIMRN